MTQNNDVLAIRRETLQELYNAVLATDEEGLAGHAEPVQAARMILELPRPAVQHAEPGDMADAYVGAREDLAIWKRRALEAEQKVRQQEQIIDHLTREAQGETRFGEPLVPSAGVEEVEVVGYGFQHVDKGWLLSSKPYHVANPCLEGFRLMTVAQHRRIVERYQEWVDARGRALVAQEELLPAGVRVSSVQVSGHLDEIDAPVWEFINAEARKLGPLTGSIESYNFTKPNGAQPNGVVAVLWNGAALHAVAITVRDALNRTQCVRALLTAAPATVNQQLTTAARDVLAERQRQITAEGWTPKHDDEHDAGELAAAASAYAMNAADQLHPQSQGDGGNARPITWPWDDDWWKPGPPRQDLIKAGALILAEIERLDRAEQSKQQEQQP